MLRKLVIVAVLLAVIAAAAFWFITMPETVSADALGPYSPDLDNGKTMFYAGGWSEANFVTAMWKGTSPDGSHYYPVFPYPSYQRMRLEDVRDLFAYLKTLPAVQGKA